MEGFFDNGVQVRQNWKDLIHTFAYSCPQLYQVIHNFKIADDFS
jgi:hypothetical protein